jgi:hypothetical protein
MDSLELGCLVMKIFSNPLKENQNKLVGKAESVGQDVLAFTCLLHTNSSSTFS